MSRVGKPAAAWSRQPAAGSLPNNSRSKVTSVAAPVDGIEAEVASVWVCVLLTGADGKGDVLGGGSGPTMVGGDAAFGRGAGEAVACCAAGVD